MAKINERDMVISFGELIGLRKDGWVSTETGDDFLIALAKTAGDAELSSTGEIELVNPETDAYLILDFEVQADGIVNFALRARCECGNPHSLCHPEA